MTGRLRVVLVDDYEPVRTLLRVAFEAAGDAEVVAEASDIAEALEAFERLEPDVIIVDLSVDQALPALVSMRRRLPRCRIIAYSAQPAEVAAANAADAGADAYVEKGAPQRLLDVVRGILGAPPDSTVEVSSAAAVAAHGLMNNLTVIRGAAATLLAEPALPEHLRDELHAMLCQQMSHVIEGFDGLPAVAVHQCLNELAPSFLACDSALASSPDEYRRQVFELVVAAVDRATDTLGDVARGLPPEVRAHLDRLRPEQRR